MQVVRRMLHFPLSDGRKNANIKLPDDYSENGWELIGFVQDSKDGHITAANRVDLQAAVN